MNNLKVCFALGFFILLSSGASQADTVTLKDWNLTCLIIDGEGSNDVLTILRVDKSGNANGTICYVDLGTTTLLEKCHPVRGTVTGVQLVKVGLLGVDFLPDSNTTTPRGENSEDVLTTFTAAYKYTILPFTSGIGMVAAEPTERVRVSEGTASSVRGPATAVRCKALKALNQQEPRYTLVVNPTQQQISYGVSPRSYMCPSDIADPVLRIPALRAIPFTQLIPFNAEPPRYFPD